MIDLQPGSGVANIKLLRTSARRQRKQTRREVFLAEMDQVVPRDALLAVIEPHYPKAGRGRRPYPLAPCFGCTSFSSGMR